MENYTELTEVAKAVRILSAEAVEHANSGHPGMPLGMAEIGVTLWKNHLRHNPLNPKWFNRDRFILSNGHGAMLLYSLLHLSGYNLSVEDLKNFRRLHSKTPGHPEYGYTEGVEVTTGPLGQGLAMAVGMSLAEKLLAQEFNRGSFNLIDHYTYVFAGDGCLMEGISHEACSLAGTLKLGKLIVFYDNNGISIDGQVTDWYNEKVPQRFSAYGWHVIENINGHDINAINNAILAAKEHHERPTLIICNTIIGKGSPNKAGSEESHGSPLGKEELALLKQQLNWQLPPFEVPPATYDYFDNKPTGSTMEAQWNEMLELYNKQHPALAQQLKRCIHHELPADWAAIKQQAIKLAAANTKATASRKSSQQAIEYYSQYLPELFGGSADLTGSNLTKWSTAVSLSATNHFTGNYLSYGVREFAMSAMLNGIYLHGGLKPFGGTFLTFSDYARNAVRLAALMKIAPIFVYTHDSIGLGEDGPTHQPIEHLASLRLIPNLQVWRPCDAVETFIAWGESLSNKTTPSCLVFSRQNLAQINRESAVMENITKGGYILRKNSFDLQIVIIATGSEVELALQVYENLTSRNYGVQLVSMPCTTLFDQQPLAYKQQVLPPEADLMVAIEAGIADYWYKYVGSNGLIIGMHGFGESAKAEDLFKYFGFTVDAVVDKIIQRIDNKPATNTP